MTDEKFYAELDAAKTPKKLAELGITVMEESLGIYGNKENLYERFEIMLEKGLDPTMEINEESVMNWLIYGYSDVHLDVAKMIFDKIGVPEIIGFDDEYISFEKELMWRIDFDCYTCEYDVKLFLLALAYTEPLEYLQFNENLYKEMFSQMSYTSRKDISEESEPLVLTQEIFKDIHRFDYTIEMLEQKENFYGCWRLRIFDKKTKIEVAVYH